jgi:hypothetical protein
VNILQLSLPAPVANETNKSSHIEHSEQSRANANGQIIRMAQSAFFIATSRASDGFHQTFA